jgi:hypothetical protein
MLAAPSVSAGNFLLIDYSFRPPFPLLKMRAPPEAEAKNEPDDYGKEEGEQDQEGKVECAGRSRYRKEKHLATAIKEFHHEIARSQEISVIEYGRIARTRRNGRGPAAQRECIRRSPPEYRKRTAVGSRGLGEYQCAQQANEWDMEGHAQKAKNLLGEVNRELRAAANAANRNAK